uniref:Uncharacterized protein n=1 Tax=Haptolina brevifila TaxID=156173 RepID=A0A7S2H9S1_9EUKA|mmetsp:Transcript_52479/g.104290  ORF Transcript_52479/g.104290 Transcript_52479/m.104290 type:complete len:111 (+) Transcript_52479:245-577(+)
MVSAFMLHQDEKKFFFCGALAAGSRLTISAGLLVCSAETCCFYAHTQSHYLRGCLFSHQRAVTTSLATHGIASMLTIENRCGLEVHSHCARDFHVAPSPADGLSPVPFGG